MARYDYREEAKRYKLSGWLAGDKKKNGFDWVREEQKIMQADVNKFD